MSGEPLRTGLLVDGSLRGWEIQALDRMVDAGAELETALINTADGSSVFRALKSDPAYFFVAGRREIAARLSRTKKHLKHVPLSEIPLLGRCEHVYCEPIEMDDYGRKLDPYVVETHCNDLDVLVRFGFGVIRGDILTAPRFGVLSYHHGDITEYRGRPAGFWEYMNGEDSVGITLQKLSEEIDGGGIVQMKQIELREDDSYHDILDRLYLSSVDMLGQAVIDIREGVFNPRIPEELGDFYYAPGWKTTLRYFVKEAVRSIRKR